MAVDCLNWKSGLEYDEIRANREAARDAEVLRLIEMGGWGIWNNLEHLE